jgi:hypothetical protein
MKPRLVPLYFDPGRDSGFDTQLHALRTLLASEAEFLTPMPLGSKLPECEAVLFPQLLGEAYRRVPDFRALNVPLLIITSEFGTLSMWDWELITYLKSEGAGAGIIAPYNLDLTRVALRALALKRSLRSSKFVVYQDNPGEGMQAPIFKRFYWWESECVQRMTQKFGITIEKRSFKKLGAEAKCIPDTEAEAEAIRHTVPHTLPEKSLNAALKLYLAIKQNIADDPSIQGAGINCLNESAFSDCTPCLAWNFLYQERGLIWGCEADVMAMLTKLILHRSLEVPVIMTNLYPFLLGQAALKHERIPAFPQVEGNPRDYILAAHCGYLGVVPQSFATQWTLRKKVLAIVDETASAIDARLPEGSLTLAKLHPNMTTMSVVEGELTGYAGYPGSDCLNGGVIRVPNGHRLMNNLASHHYLLATGHHLAGIELCGIVFGLELQPI